MINPILKHEIEQYIDKMELINEYPNIFIFLEKTLKMMKLGQEAGL